MTESIKSGATIPMREQLAYAYQQRLAEEGFSQILNDNMQSNL